MYVVDTLADAGPGSLRECMQATGARTCVFAVSGTIDLMSPIWVKGPNAYLTVAGQTSPGGIQIREALSPTDGRTPIIMQDTSEIILRHLRVRGRWDRNNLAFSRSGLDSITGERVSKVVLDHISTTWAADEQINFHQGAQDVTVQNTIMAESLSGHAYGALSCSDAHQVGCGRFTWYGNVFQSFTRRSPSDKTAGPSKGVVDVINNVISNSGLVGIEIWDDHGGTWTNIVGNVGQSGALNTASVALINEGNVTADDNVWYASDNIASGIPLYGDNAGSLGTTKGPTRTSPVAPLSVTPIPASQTLDYVLNTAGAWPRDTLDTRLVNEVRAKSGPARSPVDGGPWPTMGGGVAPLDSDKDGMPDTWEAQNGLNANDATDRNSDKDADGYTNLEEYLEERHLTITASGYVPPPPPASTKFTLGNRVQTTATLNVRGSASPTGTLLGTQVLNTLGTVVSGPTASGGFNWWNINFDTGADGWSVEDFMVVSSGSPVPPPPTSAPTVTLSVSPVSITAGQSSSLTWSSTNATSCTASNGWTGAKATSGTQSVSPTANTTYTMTCTGAGGSANQSTTVTVTSTAPPPPPTTSGCSTPLGSTPHVRLCSVTRSPSNPLVTPAMAGVNNLNGPSVIRVPTWLPNPLGQYYMYFADHRGDFIKLSYANNLHGPWSVYAPGTLQLPQATGFNTEIASPDVHVLDATRQIRLYFSGPYNATPLQQETGVAHSSDGINFVANGKMMGNFYFRVWQWNGKHYATARGKDPAENLIYEGTDPTDLFTKIKDLGYRRHEAVLLKGDTLLVFYSRVGDAPERILLSTMKLTGAPSTWTLSQPIEVLRPTTAYEGAAQPVKYSEAGGAVGANQLRDPYVFEENGKTYLFYSIAGESGIAMAEITYELLPTLGPEPTVGHPTVNLYSFPAASVSTANLGRVALLWSATDATSCTASGGWSGSRLPFGQLNNVAVPQTTTFGLTCTGPGGTASHTVTVEPVASVTGKSPVVVLSATPARIAAGQATTLTWSTTNATTCTASSGWSGAQALSGSMTVSPTQTTDYTLTCSGNYTGSHTVTVEVGGTPAPPPPAPASVPSVTLSASPASITSGQLSTLSWSSANATSCAASGGWSGALGTSGSQSVSPTANTTYTLTCTGAEGSANQSTAITVTSGGTPAPTSSATIGIGSRIVTTANTNVRAAAPKGTILGTQTTGAPGTIIAGPVASDSGIRWWQIDYDAGVDGWSVETYLAASSVQLPVPLKYGIVSEWVAYLQRLLNQDPDTQVAAVGAGSQGNETNYFGAATRRAVQAFQQKYNVATSGNPGYGIVGPRTTEKLKQIFGF
ncbi:MAG: Uncharacterized protein G01um101456_290 [Parcubacteria group bacterium Gr01-1014_56]|nr:MAG: Uncharacterized protein G01um101456_290 [Parcubacteria group bacterium Gr01-1014_56]